MKTKSLVRLFLWIIATFTLSAGWQFGCIPDPSLSDSPVLTLDVDRSQATTFAPHPLAPIVAGQNLMWCATFQLAWDQLCKSVSGDIHLQPPEDPMVSALNRHSVNSADLDPESYLAIGGRGSDGIVNQTLRAMHEKFPDARPRLLPTSADANQPNSLIAYCYLFKKLDFPVPFERLDSPLEFLGTKVTAFGMARAKPGHEKMAQDVSIIDYKDADDFIIELKSKSPEDHLILAKIQPGRTLDETIAAVSVRQVAAKPTAALAADVLAIPKMNFDITHSFPELEDKLIVLPLATALRGQQIASVEQNIRFLMDEHGVKLESETETLSFACDAKFKPEPQHIMEFNKPFLLMMSREGGRNPYFAMWVNNADLLAKAEK